MTPDSANPATFAPFAGLSDDAFTFAVDVAYARQASMTDAPDFPTPPLIGERVRLRRDINRCGVVIPKGTTLTVVESHCEELHGYICAASDDALDIDAIISEYPVLAADLESGRLFWTEAHDRTRYNTPFTCAADAYAARPFWHDCARIVPDITEATTPIEASR